MKTVVFQGDSITDCGRNFGAGMRKDIGQGYAVISSAKLSYENPGKYEFYNRGISGNRIVDIYARIKKDCWNFNPDVLSLLAGINGVLHETGEEPNGVDAKRFEKVYEMLIEDTIERFPNIKIILMSPFITRHESREENWDYLYSETQKRIKAVERIAKKYNCTYIPLQEKFDEAINKYPDVEWVADGVHPNPIGHQLIAEAWLEAFREIEK